MRRHCLPPLAWTLLALLGCAPGVPAPAPSAPAAEQSTTTPTQKNAAPAATPATATVRLTFYGDSLTAGYGLPPDQAFPALLGRALTAEGLPVTVVNAGVSGDTTAGGLARLDWTLSQHPDVFVLALGGNDVLRGLPVAEARANLRAISERASAAGASVVLAGMRANPSLGPEYVTTFNSIFPDLAAELRLPLLPFLLDGVAGDPLLTQADGVHPTAEGHRHVAALLLPILEPIVRTRAHKL